MRIIKKMPTIFSMVESFCSSKINNKDSHHQSLLSDKLCFSGIHKDYSPKSCIRAFRKYFGDIDGVSYIYKPMNKPFFFVIFDRKINP